MNWVVNCLIVFLIATILSSIYSIYRFLRSDQDNTYKSPRLNRLKSQFEVYKRARKSTTIAWKGDTQKYQELRELVDKIDVDDED